MTKIFAVVCPNLEDYRTYRAYLLAREKSFTNTGTTFIIDDKIFMWFNGNNADTFRGLELYSIIRIGNWYEISHQDLAWLETRLR